MAHQTQIISSIGRRLAPFFLMVGTISVCLMICEGILRVYQSAQLKALEAEAAQSLHFDRANIQGLHYQMRPNLALRYRTNEFGWRGQALLKGPAPADEVRVAIVGDSIAFGLGIYDDRDTFAGQLETILNEAAVAGLIQAAAYRVYNFGVPGYTAWDTRAVVNHLLRQYDIDLIVYVFCFNDFVVPHVLDEQGLIVAPPEAADDGGPFRRLVRSSVLLRFFANVARPVANHWLALERSDRYSSQPRWAEMKEELCEMVNDVHRASVPMVSVIVPLGYHLTFAPGKVVSEHQDIQSHLRSLGVPTVETLDDYREMGAAKVFPLGLSDGHPSSEAVGVTVQRLFTSVLRPAFGHGSRSTPTGATRACSLTAQTAPLPRPPRASITR
jgi:hypothetical protein